LAKEVGAAEVVADDGLGKVSIVGTGIQSAPGYAARLFRVLSDEGINIDMISTGEIRITCIIRRQEVEHAVKTLHKAFEMEKAEPSEL
jgi:aspartate kinase